MTKQEIINSFRLFMDDSSELSTAEESSIFERNLQKVWNEKTWEFSKKEATGTTDGTSFIPLPSDFLYMLENQNYSESFEGESTRPYILIGDEYYKVVSWSDRKKYANRKGYAWIDLPNSRIGLSDSPAGGLLYSFDYKYLPAPLGLNESPPFPGSFHHILYHAMCVDSFIIQQSEKAKSYAPENGQQYQLWLDQLVRYNANLVQL